jgi:1,4-dihydroxy-2-naphthoate octaprenyltransferase
VRIVLGATQPSDFIPALGETARLEMATAVLLAIGLVVS